MFAIGAIIAAAAADAIITTLADIDAIIAAADVQADAIITAAAATDADADTDAETDAKTDAIIANAATAIVGVLLCVDF